MNFDPTMPTCPVCSAATSTFTHQTFMDDEGKWAATERSLFFECGALYKARAERQRVTKLASPLNWTAKAPCSKAQEIALKLLRDRNKTEDEAEEYRKDTAR